jgi:hypothetical protein
MASRPPGSVPPQLPLDRLPDVGVRLVTQPMLQPSDSPLAPEEAHGFGSDLAHVGMIVLEEVREGQLRLDAFELQGRVRFTQ